MNYYNEIKDKLINNEIYKKVKDYSKNKSDLNTYFEVGKLLVAAGKHYGDNVIEEYSKKLVVDVGKKYNRRTLYRIKQFYIIFSDEKVSPLVTLLNWSHCIILLSVKDINEINYYIEQIVNGNLSKRELEEKIKSKEYERLPIETKNKLIVNKKESSVIDLVKNPIIIKNKYNVQKISEKVLQQLILEDIPSFLKELGDGFTFIENEYKIKIGDRYNYIDLLLYNIKYRCYVVIELKVIELNSSHIGQIEKYMNYIDKNVKSIEDNKTIGIIICKKDNKYVIEYCSDSRIISRNYELV